MDVTEHSFPTCTVCGMPHNGYEGPCLEPGCPGRVTWEATADRLYEQLQGVAQERDALLLFARNYAKWQTTADLNLLDAQVRGLLIALDGEQNDERRPA